MGKSADIDSACTAQQISDLLGVSVQAVHKRSREEQWKQVNRRTRGGYQKLYPGHLLPADIQTAMAAQTKKALPRPAGASAAAGAAFGRQYAHEAEDSAAQKKATIETGMAKFAGLPIEKQRQAEARLCVLQARAAFVKSSHLPLKKGSQVFCREVKAGRIKLPEDAAESLYRGQSISLSWPTLNRWRAAHEAQGLYGLTLKYKTRAERGADAIATTIPPQMTEFIIGLKVEKPHVRIPLIRQALSARFDGQTIPHIATIRRFVARWEEQNQSILLYIANPDEWKNRHLFAVGRMDEDIERLNQRWELDSTPGDVMLVDGRHTVIGCIDILSRRMKLQVSKTSNSAAIGALIRNSILDWGVPEILKTDNGTDYVSNHIVRVLADLEVEQRLCTPFSPEEKPFVERALGTFSHDIVELLPGYVGHSVADRKSIEARRSFAQRLMKQGETVEVNMTAAEFQVLCNRWINAMYHQNPHSGLAGRTPAQVAREWNHPVRKIENPRALDLLLCPAPDTNGTRVIRKKGVEVGNLFYSDVGMAGHEGETVRVLVDPADLGAVYCYLESGEFLCKAIEPNMAGEDRAEHASRVKAVQNRIMKEGRARLKKVAQKTATRDVYQEILAHGERQIANLAEFPHRSEPYTTPALEEAARAMDDMEKKAAGPKPIEITPEEERGAREVIALAERRPQTPMFGNDWEKYDYYLSALRSGGDVADEILAWMKRFEVDLEGEEALEWR